MSVCPFNSFPKSKYSNLFIVEAFYNRSFSGKTSFPLKNSYLITFTDNKQNF